MKSTKHKLAVIDVGSNTVRLLVVEGESASRWRVLHQAQEITRLGEGLRGGSPFSPRARQRTLDILKEFSERARRLGAERVRAIGTSAMRRAADGTDFVTEAERACHMEFSVVSGTEEARITLRGVEAALNLEGRRYLLIDIGGGSTEYVLVESGRVLDLCSFELGAVSLTEGFFKHDPPPEQERGELFSFLRRELASLPERFAPVPLLVGTAGTVTTLAAVAQEMERYQPEKINNFVLGRDRTKTLLERFYSLPLEERRLLPGLEAKRADIIIAGTMIFLVGMELLGAAEALVSDAGFREGIVLELFKDALRRPPAL